LLTASEPGLASATLSLDAAAYAAWSFERIRRGVIARLPLKRELTKLERHGTTRVVVLDNGGDHLPDGIAKYLDMTSPRHSYIYGDFEICPREPDEPGHMRRVCVASAENSSFRTSVETNRRLGFA
jgi:hypothetical protein